MSFWQDVESLKPKRAYRFLLFVNGARGLLPQYLVKSVTKPGFAISESPHNFLNHTFKYPGRLTWSDVTLTIVDVDDHVDNGTQAVMDLIEISGYKMPTGADVTETISKAKSTKALGQITIRQIDDMGEKVEDWVLNNAWIKDVKFGDLDYSSDDMLNVALTIAYDNAYVNVYNGEGKFPSNALGAN